MPDGYAQINHELAPYQGFPSPEPTPVGDPHAGAPVGTTILSRDAAGELQVLQSRRQVGNPAGVALSESTLASGGFLIPAVTR